MFLFPNRDHIQEIIAFLYTNPSEDALKNHLIQSEFTDSDLQQLVDFINANPTSVYALSLIHGLFEVVKYAFRNTQFLFMIMDHTLTDTQEKKFCAEKLLKRIEKLKDHPAYQFHLEEYLLYEAESYRVLGDARCLEGYPEGALPYYRQGFELALKSALPDLAERFEKLIENATNKIRDDESLSKSLTHVIEGLRVEIDEKQRELASLLQIETIQSIQEKVEEVERLANLIERRQTELESLNQQVDEAHKEIQISKTRLELLQAKIPELDEKTEELGRIHADIIEHRRLLDELKQQVAQNHYLIDEFEKAKSDTQAINDAIATHVDQLSAIDRQLKERTARLEDLDSRERVLRSALDDLKQQEQALQIVVAEMDEKIQKTIDYTYRQRELDEEQKRVAVNIEKQNSVVSSLNRTIGDLNTTIVTLKQDIDRLNAQKASLEDESSQARGENSSN
jgi:chromosome segregation ATPase